MMLMIIHDTAFSHCLFQGAFT